MVCGAAAGVALEASLAVSGVIARGRCADTAALIMTAKKSEPINFMLLTSD
jgi:hypothetical protein